MHWRSMLQWNGLHACFWDGLQVCLSAYICVCLRVHMYVVLSLVVCIYIHTYVHVLMQVRTCHSCVLSTLQLSLVLRSPQQGPCCATNCTILPEGEMCSTVTECANASFCKYPFILL